MRRTSQQEIDAYVNGALDFLPNISQQMVTAMAILHFPLLTVDDADTMVARAWPCKPAPAPQMMICPIAEGCKKDCVQGHDKPHAIRRPTYSG
jgi:hypothetical protein